MSKSDRRRSLRAEMPAKFRVGNLSLTGYSGEERSKIAAFLRGLLGNETQTKVFGSEGSAKAVLEFT